MNKIYTTTIILFFSASTLFGQMYPDRHNTSWFNSWISCSTSPSPNSDRGDIHWIMYDLGHIYPLGELQIWNGNIPDSTDMGLQNIIIDFSEDGTNWKELGSFTLTESSSSSIYEGEMVADFDQSLARYVLINAESNYGGNCYSMSEMKINISQATVPVELMAFNLSCSNNDLVQLNWTTGVEINNDYFDVEKSPDGLDWTSLGRIEGVAQVQHQNNYQFVDEDYDGGLTYYRLKQTDRNGSFEYSETKSISCSASERDFELYPNPAKDFIEISFDNEVVIESINLMDMTGKQMNVSPAFELGRVSIDLKDIPTGAYLIKIESNQKSFSKEFIKVK